MSYKHNGKASHRWCQWLARHRDDLIRCGVPDFVLVDELYWLRFLEEDACDRVTGWNPRFLSPQQAQALRSFLLVEYPEQVDTYRPLLHWLDEIVSQGKNH